MPGDVEYLQVADSSVVADIVACVVPADNWPIGAPFEMKGGTKS